MERRGTTKNDIERDSAGARILEGWENLVKTTASEGRVKEKKLIVCNGAVKWWDEESKETIGPKRKTHARYRSSTTRMGGICYS